MCADFRLLPVVLALPLLMIPGFGEARVSQEEAAQLGTTLTDVGANPAGNADGSIPAYTGSMLGQCNLMPLYWVYVPLTPLIGWPIKIKNFLITVLKVER